ncbi:MAG: hypothetical protein PHC61_01065 [Chitinivibrionales bacterium]|nr:hypothetical protein [Chitinivibrionales bacterium]
MDKTSEIALSENEREVRNRIASLVDLLHLSEVNYCGDGLVRARQALMLAGQTVCHDEVLIEGVFYATRQQALAETNNLVTKKGAFLPFETGLTRMPKYCFNVPDVKGALFVHSVPALSLQMVLDAIGKIYRARYNYDFFAYCRDCLLGVRDQWLLLGLQKKRPLLPGLKDVVKTLLRPLPRLSRRDRIAFAGSLVAPLLNQHHAGIYGNNISDKTIFMVDGVKPVFLANYAGVDSAALETILPPELRVEAGNARFGPAVKDAYCLAVLTYIIITWEVIDFRQFSLDAPGPFNCVPFAQASGATGSVFDHIARFPARLAWGASVAVAYVQWLASFLDNRKYVPLRKLIRAGGSPLRSLPLVNAACDFVFYPRRARILAGILDRNCCRRTFSGDDKRPVTLDYLIGALPYRRFGDNSAFKCFFQRYYEKINGRSFEYGTEIFKSVRPRHLARLNNYIGVVIAGLFGAILIILGLNVSRNERLQIGQLGTVKPYHSSQSQTGFGFRDRAQENSPVAYPNSQDQKQAKKIKPAPKTMQAKNTPGSIDKEVLSPYEDAPKAVLVQVKDETKVFKIQCGDSGVDLGRVFYNNADGSQKSLAAMASGFTKYFISIKIGRGYGPIKPMRRCEENSDICRKDLFYEAIGYRGTGEHILMHDGDLFAFNYFDLFFYNKKNRPQ